MVTRFFPAKASRILILRQAGDTFYDVIVKWIADFHPELSPLFRIRDLPHLVPSLGDVVLHVPWLQDPVQMWSRRAYFLANRLARKCDRRGIPVINRVDRLTNVAKSTGARLMAATGLRTPVTVPIVDKDEFRETLLGIGLPLLVRDDWGHRGDMLRANTREEAQALPIEKFTRPIAVEVIDVPSRQDGFYRKFRYVAAGEIGISHHLLISNEWITRGDSRHPSDATREEELAYCEAPDANHAALQRAREALGLEFLAFDYSYDYEGRVVVWEANPYPYFHFSKGGLIFRNHIMHRTIAAVVMMYLQYGGLPVSEALERDVAY